MGELEAKLNCILRNAFPRLESLEIVDNGGIIGVLVTDEFEGMEVLDRQNKIWDVLDRTLEPDEKRSIQIIVASTPEEHMGHAAIR